MNARGMTLDSTSAATSAPNWSSAIICRVPEIDAARASVFMGSLHCCDAMQHLRAVSDKSI